MNEVEKRIVTDEIKGLLNGISSISCSTVTAIDFKGTEDVLDQTKLIQTYIDRIEEKVHLIDDSTDSDSEEPDASEELEITE